MTRWIGFVLGAALALAAVHRLGVCDLVPVRDNALAVGRAIFDRVPADGEARPGPDGAVSTPVPERQSGTADETAASVGGVRDGRSADTAPEALPGSLAASRPRRPSEEGRVMNEQAGAPFGGMPPDPGGLDTDRDVESKTEDARVLNPVPAPGRAVFDDGLFIDQPEAGAGIPRARPGRDASGGEFPSLAGAQASVPAASIWAPFRSRRSAEGFADHLHERFGADLEVRRAGPGVYGVYLTAATEDELADGLARLRSAGALPGLEARR